MAEDSEQKMVRPLVVQLRSFLESRQGELAAALPAHIKPERMIRLALTEFDKTKDLQSCTPQSVYSSILLAAQVGLEIGVMGQAYLVPYKDKRGNYICTFVPGWKGIIGVVSRSGKAAVRANAVYEGDEFDYGIGTGPFVTHKPGRKQGQLTHVYAIGEIAGMQDRIIEVWHNEDVQAHFRKFNKVGERHYANKNWEMYARKVPLLQVCKYLPQTVEMQNVIEASYAAERGENLVVDEFGVPLNAGMPSEDAPKKEIIKPRRKAAVEAEDVQEKPGAAEPASPGQIAWLKRKGEDQLKAAMRAARIKSLDGLTLDGFNAIKDGLK